MLLTPPHLGKVLFDSPSNISLINLSIEHSVFITPLNISLVLLQPTIHVIITKKFMTETTMKKGHLQSGFLQQLKQ